MVSNHLAGAGDNFPNGQDLCAALKFHKLHCRLERCNYGIAAHSGRLSAN